LLFLAALQSFFLPEFIKKTPTVSSQVVGEFDGKLVGKKDGATDVVSDG